jgi:hypothetical protein
MDILSFTFIVLVVVVVGSAWFHLRSNWRSVQSMRTGQKAAVDDAGFDLPEGPDCSHQHGHGPRARITVAMLPGTTLAASTWAITEGSTEVAGITKSGFLRDRAEGGLSAHYSTQL